jgi:hypothetical protein
LRSYISTVALAARAGQFRLADDMKPTPDGERSAYVLKSWKMRKLPLQCFVVAVRVV